MAQVKQLLELIVDPSQPVAEINNVITVLIGLWSGSEADILKAVRKHIDEALPKFEKKEGSA